MARNEEKAQSMLYRFRQAKAMEMGLITNQDRRPRIAAMCKDLRQCERWRGEILREISRKVSKIQDYGLTDYEVRDLNDEINKLMREKSHWENQIVALGGANYKRAAPAMRGADGREVPGMRGYKYFGRARELPGVKELFESAKEDQDELLSHRKQRYAKYENAGPEYYGELDEQTQAALLAEEKQAEQEEWQDALADVAETLDVDVDSLGLPDMPTPDYVSLPGPSNIMPKSTSNDIPPPPPPDDDDEEDSNHDDTAEDAAVDAGGASKTRSGKRKQTASSKTGGTVAKAAKIQTDSVAAKSAANANRIYTVIREEDFRRPELPSLSDLEAFLVDRQKQELLSEYI